MGKIHAKPKIVTMSYNFFKLALIDSNKLQLVSILIIRFLFFPQHTSRLKHAYPFCFQILNNLLSFNFYNCNKLGELKMVFRGVEKYP